MLILDISSWWQALTSLEKIFWAVSILFSVLFVIQLILSFVVGDGDASGGSADEYVSGDDGTGHQFFTIKNMIAFFTIFGWAGLAYIRLMHHFQ